MKTKKIILLATLIALAITTVSGSIYAYYSITSKTIPSSTTYNPYTNSQNWTANSMGGMMSSGMRMATPQTSYLAQNSVLSLTGISYVALLSGIIAGTGGLSYLTIFRKVPNRKQQIISVSGKTSSAGMTESPTTAYDSISKTLTSEENQVLDSLKSHGGRHLQKYIRSETGLSRLKIHRIVARLAERGIVTLEKTGNTNQVVLADWINAS